MGAGVFGGVGSNYGKSLASQYSEIGKVLPYAARPPEGIAILTAAINAVTGYTDLNPRHSIGTVPARSKFVNCSKRFIRRFATRSAAGS